MGGAGADAWMDTMSPAALAGFLDGVREMIAWRNRTADEEVILADKATWLRGEISHRSSLAGDTPAESAARATLPELRRVLAAVERAMAAEQ